MRPRAFRPRDGVKRRTDRRYNSARWRLCRAKVLKVAGGAPTALCVWPDAPPHRADTANHKRPVYPGMPDAEFYDLANLEPLCRAHNLADGFLRAGGSAPRPRRFARRPDWMRRGD